MLDVLKNPSTNHSRNNSYAIKARKFIGFRLKERGLCIDKSSIFSECEEV